MLMASIDARRTSIARQTPCAFLRLTCLGINMDNGYAERCEDERSGGFSVCDQIGAAEMPEGNLGVVVSVVEQEQEAVVL